MRHAKSDWTPGYEHDFERTLNKRGRRSIKQMARWMRNRQLMPEVIVSSDAERARQTTLRLCQFAEYPTNVIDWKRSIYEASLETLLNVVAETNESTGTLLLIGHNPGIEYLVRYLADDSLLEWEEANLIPTATLTHLILSGGWGALENASAKVSRIARPRQILED